MLLKQTQVKKIINAEEKQESGSNHSQSETSQIFENLNSMENVSEPHSDISSSTDTAKKLPLRKPQSYAAPYGKKSPNWCHMKCIFLIFISPLLKMGAFLKYVIHFCLEMQVIGHVINIRPIFEILCKLTIVKFLTISSYCKLGQP